MSEQRHRSFVDDLRRGLLDGPGSLPTSVRQAVAAGREADPRLDAWSTRVRDDATRITDSDVAGLKAAGCTEDEIFEATLAAAFGAADLRLQAGLAALLGEP